MTLIVLGIVVFVLLILLTNTKRWRGLSRGTRLARRGLEEELRTEDDELPRSTR